jgi:hypothetical protein
VVCRFALISCGIMFCKVDVRPFRVVSFFVHFRFSSCLLSVRQRCAEGFNSDVKGFCALPSLLVQ